MSKSEDESKQNYIELTRIENEQNWKFIRLLIGFSIGILAFSLQTYDNNNDSTWLIKISWFALLLSFFSGMQNLRYFQKILSRRTKSQEIIYKGESEVEKNRLEKFDKEINKFNKRDRFFAAILRLSFIIGVITYVVFKLINVW